MSTENIVKFLQTAYSDEKLAALLAHAQDGRLSIDSCCCLVGFPNADHAYKGEIPFSDCVHPASHYMTRCRSAVDHDAEVEFNLLGKDDAERRAKLIPLILAEMERRELAKQYRAEEEAAAEEGALIEASNLPYPEHERNGR